LPPDGHCCDRKGPPEKIIDESSDEPITCIYPRARRAVAHDGVRGRSDRVGTPGLLRELEQAVWDVNPDLPLASIQTLEQIQATSFAQTSFTLVMLANQKTECAQVRVANTKTCPAASNRLRPIRA